MRGLKNEASKRRKERAEIWSPVDQVDLKMNLSLFVGNISKYVKSFELEDEFNRFGRCEIKRNVSNVSF